MIQRTRVSPQFKTKAFEEYVNIPKVVRVRNFTEVAAHKFSEEINAALATHQTLIPVVIDSYGGDVYALLSMIDTLKASKARIATIVEGKAMSCGAILFSCGHQGLRFIGPNATLMLHDAVGNATSGKAEDLGLTAREVMRLNRKLWNIVERNIGCKRGALWQEAQLRGRADWYLTPQEAAKIGLATAIGVPTFETRLSVETTLSL